MSSATPKCITTTNDSSSTPTSLPPHTERLLQLLADGQEAVVERLAAASTSSPSTRRLLQHRLVQLLQHSQWKTRTCAARALACVVTSSSKDYQQQTTALSHTTNTLSLDWVRQHLGTILEQGQRLYAYDEDDSNQSKKNDATLPSLQQQGEILAARLGLQQLPCQQDFWQQLTSDDVDDDSTTMQPTAKRLKREDLIMMTTEKDDNTSASSSSLVDLLLFSMLDGRWQVRHGACLGILALLQQQRHATLTCSDTILAHALVVLALDRFGDFSGATCCTNNNNLMTASSVVAPVQQVAAQIVALLYRDNVMELLQELVKHKDWQVRHGALCAFEFLVARRQSEDNDMPKGVIFQLAVQALQYDESDDNKSAAALILKQCLRRDWSAACAPLVAVLETAATYSSCLVNVVSLLQLWLEMDCEKVLRNIKKNESDNNVLGRMVQRLVELLDAEFASVKLSVLLCLGSLATSRVPVDVFAKVVLRLFDFYLDDSSPAILQEDTSLSGQIVVARDKVWRLFAQSAESVIAHDMQAREALLYEMVVRYFGVGRQRAELQPTRDDFSLRLGAATALAEFLTRSKQESAVVLQIAIVSFLQSPWACQCEAACLLLRRVCLDSSSTTFEWKERYSIVYDLVSQTVPPCLVVCANNKGCETLKRYDVAKRCGEAFITCIGKSQGGDVLVVVQSIVSQWSDEFQSHGVDYKHSTVKVPANVLSMRVYCSLAGSLVALGLPAKITPTVRALMTSLKNETGSAPSLESRLGQTCCYLCDMLGTISQLDQYEAAYKKILCTVCDLAVNGLNEGIRDTPGALTLELLVSKLGSNLSLRDLDPLWMRLEAVRSTIDVDKEDMVASVRLLQIVSKGIASNNRADLLLVRDFVLPLTKFACETCEDDCFELCLSTLGSLCTLESRRLLKDALVALLPYVRSIDNLQRSKACMILETLVLDANVEVRPFVKSLLPVAMSLMTDPSEECSRKANRVFSVLVRVAPLVGQDSVALDDSFVDDNQSVIDHLIFGKPLPLCHLPPLIQGSLSKAGVLLRPYQAEGIAWLRFLQQVNLNGALCDSMGLGKSTPCSLVLLTKVCRSYPGATVLLHRKDASGTCRYRPVA